MVTVRQLLEIQDSSASTCARSRAPGNIVPGCKLFIFYSHGGVCKHWTHASCAAMTCLHWQYTEGGVDEKTYRSFTKAGPSSQFPRKLAQGMRHGMNLGVPLEESRSMVFLGVSLRFWFPFAPRKARRLECRLGRREELQRWAPARQRFSPTSLRFFSAYERLRTKKRCEFLKPDVGT